MVRVQSAGTARFTRNEAGLFEGLQAGRVDDARRVRGDLNDGGTQVEDTLAWALKQPGVEHAAAARG